MPVAERPPPLWLQVVNHYRAAIEAGELRPGDELPSIEAVAKEFGVGTTTAQRALETLRGEGLIESRAGKPSIVKAPNPPPQVASDPPRNVDGADRTG